MSDAGTSAANWFAQPRALLLQGPVGPFFGELQTQLAADGFQTKRVAFNAADSFFAGKGDCVRFSGTEEEWATWLTSEFLHSPTDVVILFGSMRPLHQTARRIAKEYGVQVISLEEGYLRAGYVSCELGGNNQHSPVCTWTPETPLPNEPCEPANVQNTFVIMSFWGSVYYLIRDAFSKREETGLFHRTKENVFSMSASWIAHMASRIWAKRSERTAIEHMMQERNGRYILVPLQVPTDSQVRTAARGWTSQSLVEASLRALERGPVDLDMVFKLHPLDRTGADIAKFIRSLAMQKGLQDRVKVFRSGQLGEMTEHSSGMIVINSTSTFSALHHEKPVLVLGDAIFRHPSVVTLGRNGEDVEKFLADRKVQNHDHIDAFLRFLRATALIPGDFYKRPGRKIAAMEVSKLASTLSARASYAEAAE